MCFWTSLVNTAQICDGPGADEFWLEGFPYTGPSGFVSGPIPSATEGDPAFGPSLRVRRMSVSRAADRSILSAAANNSIIFPEMSWGTTEGDFGSGFSAPTNGDNLWISYPAWYRAPVLFFPSGGSLTLTITIPDPVATEFGPTYPMTAFYQYTWRG